MLVAVNLLPPDRRPQQSTPLAVFLPLLGGVVLLALAAVSCAWLRFSELSRAKDELEDVRSTLASKAAPLKYVAALKEEQADFETRTKTIKEIAASRVLWTKKLDEFLDVAADDDGGAKYLLWLDKFEVKAPASTKKEARGEQVTVKGRCFAEGDPLQKYNLFHAALRASPFFMPDFAEIDDPAGKAETLSDGRSPALAWAVDLTMTMRPRESDAKKAPAKASPGRVAQGR